MMMSIIEKLQIRLQQELPGEAAQRRMAPRPVDESRFNFKERTDARLSSVLILLYPGASGIQMPLILRPQYTGVHSGQVSLPGGKSEKTDKDRVATALREAREEIGVQESEVHVIGHLTELYLAASNFKVFPVVGYVDHQPIFIPEEKEVARIIETPIGHILDGNLRKEKELVVGGDYHLISPYFDIDGLVVWGATAMMLSEFAHILNEIKEEGLAPKWL